MLTVTDTFIEYLASNLAGAPEVYWVRQTSEDEHAEVLKQDALNVTILGFYEQGSLEYALVSLDLLAGEERQMLRWLQALRDLLVAEQVIPEKDYDNFELPTGKAVSWEAQVIDFDKIRTPRGARYLHYNATFPLRHSRE